MMMNKIRTRFAPSPTGYLHIGNLRTALYAFLLAKANNGEVVLRIEDTDRERYVADGVERLLAVVQWAGIEFDEGPNIGGDFGPYTQSERLDLYKKYALELVKNDKAYYCFCTKDDLEQERVGNAQAMYSGKCRHLSKEEAETRVAKGESYVIRLKVPKGRQVCFEDAVFGKICFDTNTIDDQVLLKSDGFATYHLAVVVDDHLMEVSHVVRGNEWIPSTGKHVLLYEAFGWEMPVHVHLPVITGDDGKKLSKRKGNVFVEDFRKAGYLHETIMNFIALLGWNPGGNVEIMSLSELIGAFSIDRIKKANAYFDREKMNWMNKQYLMKLSADEVAERLDDIEVDDKVKSLDNEYLRKILEVEKSRMLVLADVNNIGDHYFVDPKLDVEKLVFKKSTRELCQEALQNVIIKLEAEGDWSSAEHLFEVLKEVVEANVRLSNGDVFWPVRYALSGVDQSPSPNELLWVLGKENSLRRLKAAEQILL